MMTAIIVMWELAGWSLVIIGLYLIYPPVAIIASGLLVIGWLLTTAAKRRKEHEP